MGRRRRKGEGEENIVLFSTRLYQQLLETISVGLVNKIHIQGDCIIVPVIPNYPTKSQSQQEQLITRPWLRNLRPLVSH